jgi:hypothetical protein
MLRLEAKAWPSGSRGKIARREDIVMESQPQPHSTSYEIGPDSGVTTSMRLLRAGLEVVGLCVMWVVLSFVMEEVLPSFRSELPLTRAWWNRVLFTGIFWSILMVFFAAYRSRRERYSLTIEPDRIVRDWNKNRRTYYKDSSVISPSDVLGIEQPRAFGRTRGLLLRTKYQRIFIPIRHPQYSEIKSKLEEWQVQHS